MPRPKLKPSEEQRKRVKALSAVGIPQEQIARQIGVRSPKTLRKHFREELDRGATDANAAVAGALYNKAVVDRDTGAMKFWLMCRGGWRPGPIFESGATQPPPFIVSVEPGGQPS
jgi:hypothetical protein